MFVPNVLERTSNGERVYDLMSRMFEDRNIFLNGEINDHVSLLIIQQFLWLESQAPGQRINFYINSPGGSVSSGLAIYDTINTIKSPVTTIGYGTCASMGCILLSAKYKKEGCKRVLLPSALVMAHQVRGGAGGQASDILIEAKLMRSINDGLFQKLADFTGKTFEQIKKDADRDHWMTAEEAVENGYADSIITPVE